MLVNLISLLKSSYWARSQTSLQLRMRHPFGGASQSMGRKIGMLSALGLSLRCGAMLPTEPRAGRGAGAGVVLPKLKPMAPSFGAAGIAFCCKGCSCGGAGRAGVGGGPGGGRGGC